MNSTILIGAVVVVILMGWLMASFLRHLRWRERLFRWRMRIFFHCVAFCAILAIAGFGYLKLHHSSTPGSAATSTTSTTTPATTTPAATSTTTPTATPPVSGTPLHVHAVTISLTKPGLWVITNSNGHTFTATDSVYRTLHLGGSYRCQTQGAQLISCSHS